MEDKTFLRFDLVFDDVTTALPGTRADPNFKHGINGAGGLEIGVTEFDGAVAEIRQKAFEDAMTTFMPLCEAAREAHAGGRVRVSVSLTPDMSNVGLLLKPSLLAQLAHLEVLLAFDATPSESWYEARFHARSQRTARSV